MSDEKKKTLINILIAILLGGGLFLGAASLMLLSPPEMVTVVESPYLTVIVKPTETPTPEISPEEESEVFTGEEDTIIQIGAVVQIFNTEGAGLRLRSNPGTSSSVQFIGDELELFTVVNGPTDQDGYVWWYLESPYDENRSGWAAAEYLQIIKETD